jgi:3-methyladenine DNA glycosylase Mpg
MRTPLMKAAGRAKSAMMQKRVEISDRARLPWRFHGRAATALAG